MKPEIDLTNYYTIFFSLIEYVSYFNDIPDEIEFELFEIVRNLKFILEDETFNLIDFSENQDSMLVSSDLVKSRILYLILQNAKVKVLDDDCFAFHEPIPKYNLNKIFGKDQQDDK